MLAFGMQVNHMQLEKKLHQVHLIISWIRWEDCFLVKNDRERGTAHAALLGLLVKQLYSNVVGGKTVNKPVWASEKRYICVKAEKVNPDFLMLLKFHLKT